MEDENKNIKKWTNKREREFFKLLREGLLPEEIALELDMDEAQIKSKIYEVKNISDAYVKADKSWKKDKIEVIPKAEAKRELKDTWSTKSIKLRDSTKEALDNVIKIRVDTHEAITDIGRKSESYDDIIMGLLKENQRLNKELDKLKEEDKYQKRELERLRNRLKI